MKIRLVVLDIDGVLTDNSVYVDNFGKESYKFSKRDGKGIELLRATGIEVHAMTSEEFSLSVHFRMTKLGVKYHFNVKNKKEKLLEIIGSEFPLEEVAFIGDDVQDLELLRAVKWAFCPQDAHKTVKRVSGIELLSAKGGRGAVREMVDYIIERNTAVIVKEDGKMKSTSIIAEIGINHNGDIGIAKKLIDVAAVAGCNYVKFQKRTPEVCVPESQKNKMRKVPWEKEEITYIQYKEDIEFGEDDYRELYAHATRAGIEMFASVWDLGSAKFMRMHTDIVKIPSALLTDHELLEYCRSRFSHRLLSTGMSTEEEIKKAVEIFEPTVLFHTNSSYPTPIEDLNFGYIPWLREAYPDIDIGYSNHYYGIVPMFAAVALGCSWLECHITLNHDEWGSDQASSIEPSGVFKLVKGVRDLEIALAKGYEPRTLYPGEHSKRESLRKL